jgi:hypothetical protein
MLCFLYSSKQKKSFEHFYSQFFSMRHEYDILDGFKNKNHIKRAIKAGAVKKCSPFFLSLE